MTAGRREEKANGAGKEEEKEEERNRDINARHKLKNKKAETRYPDGGETVEETKTRITRAKREKAS